LPQPRDSGFGFDGFVVQAPVRIGAGRRHRFLHLYFARVKFLQSFPRLFKEVNLVILKKRSGISATIGILFSLLITLFIAYETPAQSCNCYDSVSTVQVRRAPVRRVVRRAQVRTYTTVSPTATYTAYTPVVREVRYAPRYIAYVDDNNCDQTAYAPAAQVYVTEPVYTALPARNVYYTNGYSPNVIVTNYVATSAYDTGRIARGWGHRDGFKDGWKAALKYREYNPENNGDYRDANNGYKRRFGNKYLYKDSYRTGYAVGYDEGFRSINQNRVINY